VGLWVGLFVGLRVGSFVGLFLGLLVGFGVETQGLIPVAQNARPDGQSHRALPTAQSPPPSQKSTGSDPKQRGKGVPPPPGATTHPGVPWAFARRSEGGSAHRRASSAAASLAGGRFMMMMVRWPRLSLSRSSPLRSVVGRFLVRCSDVRVVDQYLWGNESGGVGVGVVLSFVVR